ncbi:MAG: 30S ribosome-binding factor RbfA [Deltaproteobacteria bacterium]|jgi:ribosome-binding factor A|nr:30S ribosome-binding factor RbfA [Deltaproteobacteria bacterium]
MGERRLRKAESVISGFVSNLFVTKVSDPRLRALNVTRSKVSPDMRRAYIYYSVMGGDEEKAAVEKALRKAKGFVRANLAKELSLRFAPEVVFLFDRNPGYAQRVMEILNEDQSIAALRAGNGPAPPPGAGAGQGVGGGPGGASCGTAPSEGGPADGGAVGSMPSGPGEGASGGHDGGGDDGADDGDADADGVDGDEDDLEGADGDADADADGDGDGVDGEEEDLDDADGDGDAEDNHGAGSDDDTDGGDRG